ncbi:MULTISPECIES: FtsX-like permease family protein [Streptomyces]|uniref:ABC transporter permease n=1 Tax=Streptomyces koelreuteriae TaxID=2838015 RepID=A0ABX8FWN2_9ACTN|nr:MULTISPECIES: ABC transporter permease [Streptomyces]QWB25492.1 ABC transporter permease [Streptomyces koelreuteriae]UUA08536.1 ABC transporter permease [Streptomyces koelreuteriae]UUA16141.1 ABC transporter permease [Streptomyces sp. CRCS-T-1]
MLALVMTTACAVLLESGARAGAPAERYAGTDVVVAGQPFVPRAGELRAALERLPSVERAVSELSFPSTAVDGSGRLVEAPWDGPSLGHSWESAVLGPFTLRQGRAPDGDSEVVLDGSLAGRLGAGVGDTVRIAGLDGLRPYRVSGVADTRRQLERQYAVFHTSREAERLADSDQPVRAVGVLGRKAADTEALRREVEKAVAALYGDSAGGLVVASGGGRAEAEFWDVPSPATVLSSLVGTFGVLSLFVAGFVVSGTLTLAVAGRLTEIGLLRAVAATKGQIRRMIAVEVLLVTVAAALLGVPGGVGVAVLLHRVLVDGEVLPGSFALSVGPVAPWATVGLAAVVAQLAAFAAARRASRVRPVEVLRESAAPAPRLGRRRVLLGVGVFAGAGGCLGAVATGRLDGGGGTAESMVLVLMIGVALLAPVICRVAGALFLAPVTWLLPRDGALAVRNLLRQNARLAAGVTPLVLALSLTGTLLCVPLIASQGARQAERERLLADHVVSSAGPGIAPGYAERAARLPGVAAASGQLSVDGELSRADAVRNDADPGEDDAAVIGGSLVTMQAEAVPGLLDLGVRAGSLARLGDSSMALGDGAAHSLGVTVGDRVRVNWDDGGRDTYRVAAVYSRDRDFADALLPRASAARHAATPLDDTVLVRTAPGADRSAVERELKALAAEFPGARTGDGAAESQTAGQAKSGAAADLFVLLLLAMINVFTAIAVVNTLSMATAGRRREFALLRLAGAQSAQVLRMLAWEAALTCVVALLLATGVCASVLVPLSIAVTGSAVPALAGGPLAALALGAVVVAVATVTVAGRLAMRSAAATPGGLARAVS